MCSGQGTLRNTRQYVVTSTKQIDFARIVSHLSECE